MVLKNPEKNISLFWAADKTRAVSTSGITKSLTMKYFYPILVSLVLMTATTLAQSSSVIVQGYVRFANGTAAPNRPVTVSIDALNSTNCQQAHTKITNANGFYKDTLSCTTSAITRVKVTTLDCNQSPLVNNPQVGPSGIVESNFLLSCNPQPATGCEAVFTVTGGSTPASFIFNSGTSRGISATDAITRRRWIFGDGDTTNGNAIIVDHNYRQPGVYQVCLTIWTASGCESHYCKTVTIAPQVTLCSATFTASPSIGNNRLVLFTSTGSTAGVNDQIISRTWTFGDGSSLSGNVVSPDHLYARDGLYNVCLRIVTAGGCIKEYCKSIEIRTHCKADFNFAPLPPTSTGYPIKFNSNISTTAAGDSIRERIWKFGNAAYAGGPIDPTFVFTTPGTYTVCLIIRTRGGCSDTTCKVIQVPLAGQVYCSPAFTFAPSANNKVQFNSSNSGTAPGDSIVARNWTFGDGSVLTGNVINPAHQYTSAGIYTVCLRIVSRLGCERTICLQVATSPTNANCMARYEYTRTGLKQVTFRSGMSWAPANDSIVERKWDFGDGSPMLTGNVITPVKNYLHQGIYTVCLKIRTRSGCESSWCSPVRVQDSINTIADPIIIKQLYPNPATVQINTVTWSQHNNVTAQLAIYDIYGVKKWGISKVLLQGDNYTVLPVGGLLPGPYFFRVTTMYGVRSRQFYKL